MSNVDRCVCCGREIPEGSQVCVICGQKPKQKQRQIDRIRNMSVDELAKFFHNHINCHICKLKDKCTYKECEQGIKQWLLSEVQEQ